MPIQSFPERFGLLDKTALREGHPSICCMFPLCFASSTSKQLGGSIILWSGPLIQGRIEHGLNWQDYSFFHLLLLPLPTREQGCFLSSLIKSFLAIFCSNFLKGSFVHWVMWVQASLKHCWVVLKHSTESCL